MQGRTQRIETSAVDGSASSGGPSHLGKYEIVGQIGQGGFGVVFQGFDPFIKRTVAIKTCTSPDQELRERYFREAEIAGRLDHPNVVRIFDFGIENDTPYLVQEFLAGVDLDHKMASSDFVPYPERLLYLIHIARGLAYAHDQDIVHRDIKPANIRILDDGTAKIMDFGVAMLLHTDTRLTKDGMAVGTAAYLAPEQVAGQATDRRTDVFSFGALAYELWTGERPFEKDTISATLYSVLHDDPKPIGLPQHVCPTSLKRLIEGCLEKDPELRIGSFAEILQDLEQIRNEMRPTSDERDYSRELRNVRPPTDPPHVAEVRATSPADKGFDPRLSHGGVPLSVRMQRSTHWRRTLLWIGLVAAVLTTYGVLAELRMLPWQPPAGDAVTKELAPNGPAPDAPTPSEPSDQDTMPTPPDSFEPEPEPDLSATAVQESTAEPAPTAAEAEIPPPPVVEKATLYLARGWHDGITASIDGGTPMQLTRDRSRELDPGTYSVRYNLVAGDYRISRTVDVSLTSGQQRRLENPIARPGGLAVQASLGSPQGLVFVDGQSLGPSPLRQRLLAPGDHRLQVFAINHPNVALVDTKISIRPRRQTIVTFDLTGRRELAIRHRDMQARRRSD